MQIGAVSASKYSQLVPGAMPCAAGALRGPFVRDGRRGLTLPPCREFVTLFFVASQIMRPQGLVKCLPWKSGQAERAQRLR